MSPDPARSTVEEARQALCRAIGADPAVVTFAPVALAVVCESTEPVRVRAMPRDDGLAEIVMVILDLGDHGEATANYFKWSKLQAAIEEHRSDWCSGPGLDDEEPAARDVALWIAANLDFEP